MAFWKVWNDKSGKILGVWHAETDEDAIEMLNRDSGNDTYDPCVLAREITSEDVREAYTKVINECEAYGKIVMSELFDGMARILGIRIEDVSFLLGAMK